ncbi:Cold-regulated 413 inner membrane protein 2 chloroplastic [Zea mays]|uniref:Cold-regulated 413 inner membrane protein 2 chloroplastic n=1 Tax=Zea mays TaxID=4577 RepID=A0A1D6F262_MAIZE|nr:Retrovirus-related Pol polyprotein LINE-1 [Zea mays]ONM25517.1 Cold-regulated 413 inner membrane protein 2 chloroplastic [Zea mays]ONM25518.1 Cold-regulated 413 inner membrane protein 2 chloroplastic [Zea mays]
MSISMRLAIPAPAVTDAAPTRLRVRVAATGNDGSLPVARAAVQAETGALRGCASLPSKPLGAAQPCRSRGAPSCVTRRRTSACAPSSGSPPEPSRECLTCLLS